MPNRIRALAPGDGDSPAGEDKLDRFLAHRWATILFSIVGAAMANLIMFAFFYGGLVTRVENLNHAQEEFRNGLVTLRLYVDERNNAVNSRLEAQASTIQSTLASLIQTNSTANGRLVALETKMDFLIARSERGSGPSGNTGRK